MHAKFGCRVAIDPWNAEYLFQRLLKVGVPCETIDPVAPNHRGMASAVLGSFTERLIALYPDERLLSDLRALRVVEKTYGVRLVSPRGPTGHGDCATSLALALFASRRHAARPFLDRPILAEAVGF